MSLTSTLSLRRLGAVIILAASAAVSASAPAADADTSPGALQDAYRIASAWQQSAYPDVLISPTPTWGCYPNDPNTRDPSRFTPDPSGFIPVFGEWKPQPTTRRGVVPTWGCYPWLATPDPSGFTPDPSGFTPDPSGFTPPREAAVAVVIPDGSVLFLPHTGNVPSS
jgi:hypothetical protein